jgi:hypothetical protein
VLVPAVIMSLGWGLRGYIGGGPYGAMIPGALVPLMLCQFLGYSARASAVVVAFGAIGVGFGGSMTYGQTLGLLREGETFWRGLTGTTLKGAVWGLLGGAVIGLGFVARHIPWRHLIPAFAWMLVWVVIGIHFINEPKLIYFSDPVNEPRDESWAGFFLGTIALLHYLIVFQPKYSWAPESFAAYATIGGAIGFGGGSLLQALQTRVSETWSWLPFWKYMEFTFGFVFGAALGLAALHLRERLAPLGDADIGEAAPSATDDGPGSTLKWAFGLLVGAVVVAGVFYGWRLLMRPLFPMLREVPEGDFRLTGARVLLGFTGTGTLLMLLSRRWQSVAWQVAVSVTIAAAAIDWQGDLLRRGHIEMSELSRTLFVLGMAGTSIYFVQAWQRRKTPNLMSLFIFATCMLMGIGYMMGLGRSEIWWLHPEEDAAAGGRAAYLWQMFRGEVIVHSIFTALFVLSILAAVREWRGRPRE